MTRQLLWAALAATVTLAPAATRGDEVAKPLPPTPPPSIASTAFTLANGLRVFVVEDHATPTVALVTYYRVGSKDELPGKTGFAHLFEHMMFKGSAHVPDGFMDLQFEEAGGYTNAFTTNDQTVYQSVASSAFLEPALYFEADRLAGLTDTLDQAKLDNQRDVVKNERRQSYENQPYGQAFLLLGEALWPAGHGNHWPTIGSMADLSAASTADVIGFFRNYYTPANATLVIVGDVDAAKVKPLAEKYLGWIPRGADPKRPVYKPPAPISKEVRLEAKDDVQVPKVYLAWRAPVPYSADEPALDLAASILADGLTSRLQKRLVYDERIAQDVNAFVEGAELGGMFVVIAKPKPGVDPEKLTRAISEEVARLARTPPTAAELERVQNAREASFLRKLEDLVARGEQLASYVVQAGSADYLAKDLARYRAVTPADVTRVAAKYLAPNARVVLTIRPEKK
jgi:zinc protease